MALSSRLMAELLPKLKTGMKLASMGYPDLIITPDEARKIVGDAELKYLGEEVSFRHQVNYPVPDAVEFFSILGIELTVYDIFKERGCERILDLNFLNNENLGDYDVVIDIGTLEHCFHIGTALINMAGFVREGGYIIHENPYNWGNHGFYNLNPTLFYDFYKTNGFEVEECILVGKKNKEGFQHECEAPEAERFLIKNQECNLITVAKRKEVKQMAIPVQTKYKGNQNES